MKKILVLAFVLLFIFPLSSCNKTPTPTPPENPQEMQTPTFAEVYPATPFSSTAYDTALTDIPARGTIKWEKGSLLVFRTGSPLKVTIYNTETASVVYEKENTDTENYSAKPYLAVETPFFSVLTQSEEDGTTTFETALYDAKGQEFFRIAENITPHIILDLIYVKNTVFRANADGSITQAFTLTSLSYVPKMTDFDTLYGNANYYYGIKNSTTKPLVCIYDQSFRLHMSYEFIGNANKATVGYLANGDLLLQYRTYAHNTDNFTYGNSQTQFDVITLLLSVADKSIKEIPCHYLIESVACRGLYSATTRNVKNISYGNFATVAFAADISNKQVPDDTTYALFAVDNLGNFTHNLSAATSNLIKNVFSVSENVFALSLQDKLSVMICNEKGEIYGDISTLKNSNLNYLISESEVFDMQLTPLLSYAEKNYNLTYVTDRALFFQNENGDTVRFANGEEQVITNVTGTDGTTITLSWVTNNLYALKTQTEESVSYTYYNDLGNAIGTTSDLYVALSVAYPGDMVLLYSPQTNKPLWKYYRCPQNPYLHE